MKGLKQGLLVVGLILSFSLAVLAYNGTYIPGLGINGTVHDLGTSHDGLNYTAIPPDQLSDGTELNRICIFCHAPHNTYRLATASGGAGPVVPDPAFDYLPLWNHTLQEDIAYTMYENGTGAPLDGDKASQAILNGMTPGSTSLLCLSCHDGSVAVNSYGNSAQISISGVGSTDYITEQYTIGQNKYLGNHHPIGFNYEDVQLNDTEIRPADSVNLTATTFVQDHLYNGNMECGTCHSVHNKGNTGERLLWRSDQNSELCLTCHDKGIYTPIP